MQIIVKRNTAGVITNQAVIEIDENTVYDNEFMGDDKITCQFTIDGQIDIQVSDYIIFNALKYKISFDLPPEETKNDQGNYIYSVTFFHPLYGWYDKIVRHLGEQTFPYTGTPLDLMGLLVDNIRLIDNEWLLGTVELIDEPQTIDFAGTSCRVGLTNVAQAFGLEYYTVGKTINLVKNAGTVKSGTVFRYGINNGLYEISRKPAANKFATVWYGEGGDKNLPDGYRSGLTRLSFTGNPVIVQPSFSKHGTREDNVTFEDIYPRRTALAETAGKIADNEWFITDSTMNFDLSDPNIAIKNTTKIVFKSGDLGGNEFLVTAYDPVTFKISFTIFQEESGYILPNDTVHANPGDKYTLIGLYMPAIYVTDAENELSVATIAHAQKNGSPKFLYSLKMDEHFVRVINYQNFLKAGDKIPVVDTEMDLNNTLRIQSISWPLVNPANISCNIADEVQYNTVEKIIKAVITTKAVAQNATQRAATSLAAALFAKQVGYDVQNSAAYSMFTKTTITNLSVLSAAFVAGNPYAGTVGGINGTAFDPGDVVFWAGSDFANRDTAPFRVLLSGKVYMTDADVSGIIHASAGTIGNWNITNLGLENVKSSQTNVNAEGAYIRQKIDYLDGSTVETSMGTNLDGASVLMRLVNWRKSGRANSGLYISVANGSFDGVSRSNNLALHVADGDILLKVKDRVLPAYVNGFVRSYYDTDKARTFLTLETFT